ncbi:MAG: hypothetical protein KF862_07120 [Chitinophagaceae bacterium]|nr:hypothetical protein [Chitinophagaceae bacterium]
MQFDEKLAAEIVEKNNLPKAYVNKWRFTGRIPDSYFKKNDNRDNRGNIEADKLRSILSSDKLNIETLSRLTKISRGRIENFSHRGDTFNEGEVLSIKKALSEIRISAKKVISFIEKLPRMSVVEEKEVKKIIDIRYFYVQKVCENDRVGAKINEWVRGKRESFPFDTKEFFLQGLLVFIVEISL